MSVDIAVVRRAARCIRDAGVLTVFQLIASAGAVQVLDAQSASSSTRTDTTSSIHVDSLLDLPTVIRRALDVSPLMVASEGSVRTAQSEQRVATGAYIPSLSANSSVLQSNITTVPIGATPTASYSAGLSSSIDVYTGGRRSAERARSQADLAAAEVGSIAQRFSVTLTAQRAFYDYLRANELLGVARARVAQAERGFRYAQSRVRAGTTTKSDELRARLELTSGQQQLLAALDTLQTAAYTLGRIVGANGPIGALGSSTDDPKPLSLSDSEIIRMAVSSSPLVRTAKASEQASAAATRSARSLYLPDLRVTGGYNWANQTPILGGVRPGWTVALGTSFPLFNGFQREDAVARADAAAETAHVTALDATRQARAEAARLLSGLRFAEQNIALAREAVQSAQEDLRVQSERYQAGISTELDQLTSQLAVTQAELGLVAAHFNYQIIRAQLEALVGRTL
jgi:outer membrane protein TolC